VLAKWTWADSKADVEKNYQALMAKLAEVKASSEAAKQAIQRRMNLRDSEADRTADEQKVPGISAQFAPADDESWIDIDVSGALPLRKWVHPDDYAGVNWHVYLSADQSAGPPADDDAEKLKTGFVVPGTARTLRCPSGELRYAKTAYVWVRMHAREEVYDFVATKWAAAEATHTPWLRPARGVQLGLVEEAADDEAEGHRTVVVVDVPPVAEAASDWDVALVSPGLGVGVGAGAGGDDMEATETENSLFRAAFFSAPGAKGPAKFRIDVAQLGYNRTWPPTTTTTTNTGPSAVVARVRQRPWDPALHHTSLPSDSFQTLPVLPPPGALKAEMSGGNIVVSWAAGTTTQHVNIQLFRKETRRVVGYGIRAPAAPVTGDSSRLALTLIPDELVEGEVLSVVAGASLPPETGTLCLLAEASVSVSFPLSLTIGDDSNWDAETEILTMVVVANKNLPTATAIGSGIGSAAPLRWQIAVVIPSDAAGIEYEYADITPRAVQGKQAILRMKLPAPSLGSGQGGTKVMVRAASTGTSDTADAEWTLPSLSGTTTDIGEVSCAFEDETTGKSLVLRWANGQEGVDVTGTVLCETMAFKALTRTTKGEDRKCVFPFGDGADGASGAVQAKLPPSGTTLVCWCVVTAGKAVVVKGLRVEVVVP
jgi:hypothetical protein